MICAFEYAFLSGGHFGQRRHCNKSPLFQSDFKFQVYVFFATSLKEHEIADGDKKEGNRNYFNI